jgi:hypothetical protein
MFFLIVPAFTGIKVKSSAVNEEVCGVGGRFEEKGQNMK